MLNSVQERFLARVLEQWEATGKVRMVILKARQQGLSTVVSAFQYWWLSQHKANKGLVMAHESESTTTLFDMYQRLHDNVPDMLRPGTKYRSRNELVFDALDTSLRVATAGGRGVARGDTLQSCHLSEVAFWPVTFAAENFNALIQAVPNEDNTFVFVESTAQGMTGKYRELWVGACEGSSEYWPFFASWFETPEYRQCCPDDFHRTPDEDALCAQYQLDNDQLYWRRLKIGANGSDLFKQEYPATADEAFLNTGRPVFNPEAITERLKFPTHPIERRTVSLGSVEISSAGELLVYRKREPNEWYVIGADVGMGGRRVSEHETKLTQSKADPSVAQILDSKKRQVAVWRGFVYPDAFADVLTTLGYYYNTALVGCERNNHGLLTAVKVRDSGYPQIYTDVGEGALEDRETILIGHLTTEKTKPLIIDKLRAYDRDRDVTIYDEQTLREMLTYVVNDRGKLGPEPGSHDDCVMALAIATHIHEDRWTPVVVPEEFYSEAI